MPKIREKQTILHQICYYQFPTLRSTGDLDAWFQGFLASAGSLVQFGTLSLNNSCSNNSEEGGLKELEIQALRGSVMQAMRDAGANRLAVSFTYQDAAMALGLTLGEWTVSLTARRKFADKLSDLAVRLGFE